MNATHATAPDPTRHVDRHDVSMRNARARVSADDTVTDHAHGATRAALRTNDF